MSTKVYRTDIYKELHQGPGPHPGTGSNQAEHSSEIIGWSGSTRERPQELYRWMNLGEFMHLKDSSLLVTDKPDFYFSHYNSSHKAGYSWPSNIYARVSLNANKLIDSGWLPEGHGQNTSEGVWRARLYDDRGNMLIDKIKSFIAAITKIEISDNEENISISDIENWLKFHDITAPVIVPNKRVFWRK